MGQVLSETFSLNFINGLKQDGVWSRSLVLYSTFAAYFDDLQV